MVLNNREQEASRNCRRYKDRQLTGYVMQAALINLFSVASRDEMHSCISALARSLVPVLYQASSAVVLWLQLSLHLQTSRSELIVAVLLNRHP